MRNNSIWAGNEVTTQIMKSMSSKYSSHFSTLNHSLSCLINIYEGLRIKSKDKDFVNLLRIREISISHILN